MQTLRLLRCLGRGRASEVWEAEDASGARVAVKRTRAPRARLLHEARSTAALSHPGIVLVLDLGDLDGEPVVVQELAPGGALPARAASGWPDARDLLAQVLQALAHAHARGILHRDIKPGNLLCFPDPPHVRLGDFGIAHALGQASETVAGTWRSAAPEQIRGDALCPATDLYAVGCLAWLLTTGQPPFPGDGDVARFAHQFSPLPPLRPAFPVPDGFADWLEGLLEKDPALRPRLAADALAGLAAVDPGLPAAPRRRRRRPAGARLGALRRPALQGRHAERAHLLAALDALSGPSVVTISGPAGIGKTALAEWLAAHAHETGRAVTARMGDGVGALVAAALDCAGASSPLRAERIDEALSTSASLSPFDRAALLALLDDDLALRPSALRALLPRLLRHVARDRPLIWLVEGHPVPPEVLAGLGTLPVLVVRTARTESAGDLTLGPLDDQHAVRLLEDLAPLSAAQVQRLVQRGAGNPQLLVLLARDPVLPAGLRAAWRQRVLDLCPHPDALALAALLGLRVEADDWQAACAARGVAAPDLDPLLAEGLVAAEVDGFRFTRQLARESLLDHPDADALRACVARVRLEQAARWVRTGNPTPAEAALAELAHAPLVDRDRATWLRLGAELALGRGDPAVELARAAAETAPDPAARAPALHTLARALARAGDPDAPAVRTQAYAAARSHGLHRALARMALAAATREVRGGDLDAAEAIATEALTHLPPEAAGARALLEVHQSWLALKRGDWAEAARRARACRPALLDAGERLSAYHAFTYEGDAMRLSGDLDAAADCFGQAVALADAAGTWSGAIARVNQAIVLLHRGHEAAAAPLLERAVHEFQTKDRATVELAARLWWLATLDGPALEAGLERVEVLLERVSGTDPDVVEAAAFAAARHPDPRLVALARGDCSSDA